MPTLYQAALYYPYIHIADAEWVKRTLLMFPYVERMIPHTFAPMDSDEIQRLSNTYCEDGNGTLLRAANMYDPPVSQAMRRLQNHIASLLEQGAFELFGPEATAAEKARTNNPYGFQFHPAKAQELAEFLARQNLAWRPGILEPWDHYAEYVEVHPRVGTAIMSVLAIACARNEGLSIVTDEGDLHASLITLEEERVFDAILKGDDGGDNGKPADEVMLDFIIYGRCDASKLSINDLVELREEREALQELRTALKGVAGNIPSIVTGKDYRDQYIQDGVSDALRQWDRSRVRFGKLGKKIFDIDIIKQPESLMTKVMEKAVSDPVKGAVIGALTSGNMIGIGGGFVIGLAMHALKSVAAVYSQQKTSPYRYLTMMEKKGVVFTAASKPVQPGRSRLRK